jgi:hypothetical protein
MPFDVIVYGDGAARMPRLREEEMPDSKIFLADQTGRSWLPMTETAYDQEVVLQEALAHFPDLIPGDQINPDNPRRWLLVKRELGIPGEIGGGNLWSLDHLFLDQDGIPTFVECKRSQDTRSRREVVAQMLDYAANGTEYWPLDKLRQAAAETAQQQGQDLDEAIEQLLDEESLLDVDGYWQRVEENLRNGRIRLVFVADKIPSELRRLVEFLNAKMNDVEVLAVEVKQFLGKGQRAMVPRVIGITEATRRAKQEFPRRMTNRQEFLEACEPETRAFYSKLIDKALNAGYEISWRTKGFSIRFNGIKQKVTIVLCYPPNIFAFYLAHYDRSRMTPEAVQTLRENLLAKGVLAESGQYTLRAEVQPQNEAALLELFSFVLEIIEEQAK